MESAHETRGGRHPATRRLRGRAGRPDPVGDGPHVVAARDGGLFDLSRLAPTISDVLDLSSPAVAVRAHPGERLMGLQEALDREILLAPCDLSAIKAAGV